MRFALTVTLFSRIQLIIVMFCLFSKFIDHQEALVDCVLALKH